MSAIPTESRETSLLHTTTTMQVDRYNGTGSALRWWRQCSLAYARATPAQFLEVVDALLAGDAASWADSDAQARWLLAEENVQRADAHTVTGFKQLFLARFAQPSLESDPPCAELPAAPCSQMLSVPSSSGHTRDISPGEARTKRLKISTPDSAKLSFKWDGLQQDYHESIEQYGNRLKDLLLASGGTDRTNTNTPVLLESQAKHLEMAIRTFTCGLTNTEVQDKLFKYASSVPDNSLSLKDFIDKAVELRDAVQSSQAVLPLVDQVTTLDDPMMECESDNNHDNPRIKVEPQSPSEQGNTGDFHVATTDANVSDTTMIQAEPNLISSRTTNLPTHGVTRGKNILTVSSRPQRQSPAPLDQRRASANSQYHTTHYCHGRRSRLHRPRKVCLAICCQPSWRPYMATFHRAAEGTLTHLRVARNVTDQ